MNKRKLFLIVVALLFSLSLFACGKKGNKTEPNESTNIDTGPSETDGVIPSESSLKDFVGITFESKTFTYDGKTKVLEVTGLPIGASASFTNNGKTDVGEYLVTVVVTKEGYNDLTLTATLTITQSEIPGLAFNGLEVDYDGEIKSLEVSNLPDGAEVEYINNDHVIPGTYEVTAVVTKDGKEISLTATLTINKLTFKGVTLDDMTVDFDDSTYRLYVANKPAEATVKYENNTGHRDAGVYVVTATVTQEHYEDLVLTATLTINQADFRGLSFESKEYTYDGEEKQILLEGLRFSATVNYVDNKGTNAGTYNAKVVVSHKNYKTTTLTATLLIHKAEVTNVVLNSKSVEYDTNLHSLEVVGNVPTGAVIKYYYNGENKSGEIEVGTYSVVAEIGETINHLSLTLEATLTIKGTEEQLYVQKVGNKVYFQNNLDKNKLYEISNGEINKVNDDTPEYMISYGNDIYYFNKSLLSKNLKTYNGSDATNILQVNGEHLTTDGEYLYYAINNLINTGNNNGLYKVKLDGSEDPIKLTNDKAAYLTYHGGFIYYSNLSEGGKLYKINRYSIEDKGQLLHDEKVEYITLGINNTLYFSSSKTVVGVSYATAIYKYLIVEERAVKLTVDAGKYLTLIGDYLYYVNTDLLTSQIFGKGIYRVDVRPLSDQNAKGQMVLEDSGNGFSSLTSNGNDLYYYRLNDKHLYTYNVLTENETDLMEGYEFIEEINLTGHVDIAEYNGEIYYIDPNDNGSLYKYNPITKQKVKVLNDNVSNIFFYNDYLYYSTYVVTNYALNRMDMNTHEVIKVTSDRTDNLIFKDDLIYYIKVGSIYNNYLYHMELDGSNPTLIDKTDNLWVKHLEFDGDTFYYARNPKVFAANLSSYTIGDDKPVDFGIRAKIALLKDDLLYYYNDKDNVIGSVKTNNTDNEVLITDVDINDMLVVGNTLYYSSINENNYGLYKYDLTTKEIVKISDSVGDALTYIDGNLYFINTAISFTNDYPYHREELVDGQLYYYDGAEIIKA